MPIAPGDKLGRFKIAEPLGKGGMGEVYLARDSGLNRDVAIKVLPDSLAQDEERVRRFEREARLLASLNHPNVGAVYEFERSNGILFLALELVPGDTLTERMERGPIPIKDALVLFRQVAAALEAAHARGIVHRDLKPDNIKITPDDVVKVLDFGLAKELGEEMRASGVSQTQTAPIRVTHDGDVLGTPAYMSPEQWRAQSLDKRSDIWSFGVCLFEALAGRHPFYAKTVSDVMVAVVSTEPDFGLLPSAVPRNIIKLLRRCLQKEVHRRLHDIADARLEIEEAIEGRFEPDPGDRGEVTYRKAALVAAATLLAGIGLGVLLHVTSPAPVPVRRFTIEIPPTEPVALGGGPALALSSDGTRLVYTVRRGDTTELRLRSMDSIEPTRLPRTEGARSPFFSSQADLLSFFADEKQWRLSLSSLTAEPIAPAPSPRGGGWLGTRLVSAPVTMGGLVSFTLADTTPQAVTLPLEREGERSHRWPSMLPGGTHALFTNWLGEGFGIDVVELASGERKHLVDDASFARFAPTGGSETSMGHLVFLRSGSLWAAPFDPQALEPTEEPVQVLDGVLEDALTGAGFYDFSMEGTLIYVPRSDVADEGSGQLLRLDRQGDARLIFPAARSYQVPQLSPDERQILVTITEEDGTTNVWRYDQDRGVISRETTRGNAGSGIWRPDGLFTFSSDRDGNLDLYLSANAGAGSDDAERLTASPAPKFPNSWSPDGKLLAYTQLSPDTQFDIYIWNSLLGRSEPFLATEFAESAAVFSPDGKFLAYVSDETGSDEVYVRSVEGSDKWTLSSNGGNEPVWGGTELFYRDGSVMMAVDIVRDPDFRPGKPRALFEAPYDEAGAPYANYSVSRDGSEFVMVRSNQENAATRLMVVLGWFEELRGRVPLRR